MKSIRIGIVTFHRAKNYGAMLQAFALQEKLNEYFDVSIVDYRCPEIEEKYYPKRSLVWKLKKLAKYIVQTRYILEVDKKNRLFEKFIKKCLKVSCAYSTIDICDANKDYDIFIAGSDQVWNMKWSGGDLNYFLEFADDTKKLSYAVGIGSEIKQEYIERIVLDVSKFSAILTREEEGKKVLRSIGIKKEIQTVCDPVFLLNKEQWEKRMDLELIKRYPKKYVLVYFVAKPTNAIKFASKVASDKDCKIVYVNINAEKNIPKDFLNVIGIGPLEFLALIKNAEYIVTTSFHAMAFSIIFNKEFYYELCKDGSNSNSRLENLAEICGLGYREITDSDFSDENIIDWDCVNKKICLYSKESIEILLKEIEKIGVTT